MKEVLLLGSGFVAKPAVDYLLKRNDVHLTVLSLFQNELDNISKGLPTEQITTIQLDVMNNLESLNEYIPKCLVVISLLPATMHCAVAKMCIAHKKHLVTASYISPEMRSLDAAAKDAGVLLLNELGLDPGIDHMSSMKIIDAAKAKGATVSSFISWCGALPAQEFADNPFGYKFSWSPRGVLSSASLPATFLWNGSIDNIPPHIKFGVMQPVSIRSADGTTMEFEGVANRDSLPYIDAYSLDRAQVKTMYRGTLRWKGFSVMIRALVAVGFFSTEKDERLSANPAPTWQQYVSQLLGCNNNISDIEYCLESSIRDAFTKQKAEAESLNYKFPIISRDIDADVKTALDGIKWIGLLSETDQVVSKHTPIDTLCALLEKKLSYNAGERDIVVLQHEFIIESNNADGSKKIEKEYSQLICYGKPNGSSGTSLTVGLPVGIATELIIDDATTTRGVTGPMTPEFYLPILERLGKEGIEMSEFTVHE
ncbi:saccharopine dehydrogenase [Heterostelium album PN500]|uniref:Saccharopine dehydrogenase n=1 Tax=Heterostelium pallidum (strain ATCC 26659 / Pp 5 / PN500) TaxID=670386 RepID=D3BLY8_HETP5|nr:saccharopine dehydrogenase [Heterostelium album PN500]EFA77589.1 saccharopine dehydrogenase [Heterostelium album PN500]|eukprot:XP_020429717.1 saccharopine dehydrogenase [Heterostelium album PN500]